MSYAHNEVMALSIHKLSYYFNTPVLFLWLLELGFCDSSMICSWSYIMGLLCYSQIACFAKYSHEVLALLCITKRCLPCYSQQGACFTITCSACFDMANTYLHRSTYPKVCALLLQKVLPCNNHACTACLYFSIYTYMSQFTSRLILQMSATSH